MMKKLKKKTLRFKPHTKSDWADNEIPQGLRTRKYRFFEILPGFLAYSMVGVLVLLSVLWPVAGSVYLLIIITITLVKAVGVAFRTVQGYDTVKKAERVNWHQRVADLENPHDNYEKHYSAEVKRLKLLDVAGVMHSKSEADRLNNGTFGILEHIANLKMLAANDEKDLIKPTEVYHAILLMAYNEGEDVLGPSIEAIKKSTFDCKKIIVVLGYEERGGPEMENTAKKLQAKFKKDFYEFLAVKHPDGLPNEIKGKGPNLCYAGRALKEFVMAEKIPMEKVIVTSLDSDNRMSEKYLDYVAYEFITRPNRQRLSYQPVSLFMNNIWEATAPMRVIAISNSFFNIISTMRPHTLRNFASHSQPLAALVEMDFWSKRTIVEDGHQYWRSLFHFHGDYDVVPIHVAIYQDAVMEETFLKTLKAQFIQLRRWDYGASDVAFVGVRLFSRERKKIGQMKFMPLFAKFWRLLDGHVMLAAMSPIVAFGGWVPRLMNYDSKKLLTYNLPETVGVVQFFASIGLMATIIVSLKMLPPRPPESKRISRITMILQWLMMPVIAIVYQSFCAFYSQTRLMLGLYMEKFDVTKKVVKKGNKS